MNLDESTTEFEYKKKGMQGHNRTKQHIYVDGLKPKDLRANSDFEPRYDYAGLVLNSKF